MIESRAHVVAGDIEAALAAAKRADCDSSPEAAVTLAHAWVAAGDRANARHALATVLTASSRAPQRVHLQALLIVEPLTRREREVLRHFASLLDNHEIASEMQISIHTVKTHIKHIYRKLATARRGEAVRRARQLELI